MEENLDAILLELINEKLQNVRDEINTLINLHREDSTAHAHAHDMPEHEHAAPEPEPEPVPEPEPEPLPPPEPVAEAEPSNDSPKVDEEKAPERHHPLHGRIGGAR